MGQRQVKEVKAQKSSLGMTQEDLDFLMTHTNYDENTIRDHP